MPMEWPRGRGQTGGGSARDGGTLSGLYRGLLRGRWMPYRDQHALCDVTAPFVVLSRQPTTTDQRPNATPESITRKNQNERIRWWCCPASEPDMKHAWPSRLNRLCAILNHLCGSHTKDRLLKAKTSQTPKAWHQLALSAIITKSWPDLSNRTSTTKVQNNLFRSAQFSFTRGGLSPAPCTPGTNPNLP